MKYPYKLDLHVHFRRLERRFDTHARQSVEAAIAAGLHGIAFTEHHEFLPQEFVGLLNERYAPFRVYSGVEVSCGEDILVFGVHDRALCKRWDYAELWQFVRSRYGAVVLAHPLRTHDPPRIPMNQYQPDAVELASHNTPVGARSRILAFGLPVLANSDAHKPGNIGGFFNLCPRLPADDTELAAMLIGNEISAAENLSI